jgi:hypothetical protein
VFGLPGDRENIVMIDATHSDMCKFDNQSVHDQDNFELVRGNLEDLYKEALAKSESVGIPSRTAAISESDLEQRLSELGPVASLP